MFDGKYGLPEGMLCGLGGMYWPLEENPLLKVDDCMEESWCC